MSTNLDIALTQLATTVNTLLWAWAILLVLAIGTKIWAAFKQ